jgi:EmrB/QacA subfamily drug resistance transporter
VVLTQFIIVIDSTMMNVSITALVKDLNTDIGTIQAIIASYTLIMASLLLLGARMGDVFGRRKAFVSALIVYTVGTTIAALSVTPVMLFFGWSVLEGIGAAVMLPLTLAIINVEYSGKHKALAFGAWGSMAAAGAAFGPILGGFFTTYLSWRYAFGMEAIIAVALLAMTPMLSESKSIMKAKELDLTGAAVSAAGLFTIIFAVLNGDNWGWFYAKEGAISVGGLSLVPILIVAGILCIFAFAKWERRVKDKGEIPLLDPDMFKKRIFSIVNVVDMLESIVLSGILFIIPVFLQTVVGSNAFETGLALLPMTIMVFIFSIGAARLGSYLSPKYIIMAGIVVTLVSTLYMRGIFGLNIQEKDLMGGLTLFGVGIGLMMSQLVNVAISTHGRKKSTESSGVVNTFEQFGSSLGTALIGAIVFTVAFAGITSGIIDSGLAPEDMTPDEVADGLSEWMNELKTGDPPEINDTETAEKIVDKALADGMGAAMDTMSIMLAAMLVIMFAMPVVEKVGERKVEGEDAVLPATVAREKAKDKVQERRDRQKEGEE